MVIAKLITTRTRVRMEGEARLTCGSPPSLAVTRGATPALMYRSIFVERWSCDHIVFLFLPHLQRNLLLPIPHARVFEKK